MSWNDDSWRDGYDAWKLASPDDNLDDECWHEDYETDWEGHATCNLCGERWWLSPDELKAERERSIIFDAHCRREERRDWIRGWLYRFAFWRRWRYRRLPVDDEIPF